MVEFVLIPGAWLGRWAGERVTPFLEAQGHRVVPVTLPGPAERTDELGPAIGLRAHVDDTVRRIETTDLREVIRVGHSYAGAVVGGVARRIPHRIRAQVYVDTMPLAEGASRLDGFSPEGTS
ncbi:esterase, partial [mine drainage metagenome]